MFLTSCGTCPANHQNSTFFRPLYQTGVDKLGKRIGTIDNYNKSRTRASSYTQLLKTTTVFNHLKNNRPDNPFRPQNPDATVQHLMQIRKRNGTGYLATREGKDFNFDKEAKKIFFDGNVRYKFNNGYPANRTEEHSLFIKSDTILVIGENAVVEIGDEDTITWSDYSDIDNGNGVGTFDKNSIELYKGKNADGTPIQHSDDCIHKPCQKFTDDWSFIGGPGDEIKSIPRVLSNKRGYRSRLVNTIPGVDVKHGSYERYLARKKGNIQSCNHF